MKTRTIFAILAGAALAINATAALEKEFPEHWGEPPSVQTRDLRKLPGGYGTGSGTLAKWIESKMKSDKAEGEGAGAKASPLFDGKTLDGFSIKSGTATYVVEDGAIVGTTDKGSPNTFLCTDKEYGDFELEFDVMVVHGSLNSGVQIRSKLKGDNFGGRVYGPQVEIEDNGKNGSESGYIYGEAIGGWLTPKADLKPHTKFKSGEWNHYRIVAKGPTIQVWLNGEMMSDLTDEKAYAEHAKGLIGFQVHSVGNKGPFQVKWKNITIKEL